MKPTSILLLIFICGYSQALHCYICESILEKCSETDIGSEIECPKETEGCMISKVSSPDSEDLFLRSCIPYVAGEMIEMKCTEIDTDKEKIRNCFCSGDLCNKNWTTAGVSETFLTLPLLLTLVVFYLSE